MDPADPDLRFQARTDATKVVTTMLSCLVLKPAQVSMLARCPFLPALERMFSVFAGGE